MRVLILLLLLSSCGPSYYLRKADKNLRKAIELGAKVEADTTFAKVKFIAPAIGFATTIDSPNWSDTLFIKGKDSIQVKVKKIAATPTEPEKVYVQVDCPEREGEVEVPVAVNKEIKAGYTLYDIIINSLIFLLIGYGLRILHKMIIK